MEDLVDMFELLKDRAIAFAPRVALTLCILIVGWLVASVCRTACAAAIERASSFAQKRFKALPGPISRIPWTLCRIIPSILYALLFLLTLSIAAEALAMPLLTSWLNKITSFLPQAIVAALLVVAGFIGGSWLRSIAEEAMIDSRLPHARVVGNSIHVMTAVVSVVVGADLLGIDLSFVTTTFYIALAACSLTAGLAFALGCRATVANIVACFSLSSEYKPGARVRVGKDEGKIVRITGGYVQIETAQGLVALPGARFAEDASVLLKETGGSSI